MIPLRALTAGAVHPGYGFLSENADFARAVTEAGLVFVGPPAEAIDRMGDKVAARQAMIAAGVPCVPGSDGALPDDPALVANIAERIGYPLLIKAAGGGGGRGMRIVRSGDELADLIAAPSDEAGRYFGNRTVYLERFLEHPRHIEIQVLCDGHGNAVFLGDRDCSMQRRHQKVVEEAPAPGLDRAEVASIGDLCVAACKRLGYIGAGTFEFLYEGGQFYFIEMNTRVQVEHPVTEMVTGLDIVAAQLRIALGEPLGFDQSDVTEDGHAIECRINAEDPRTFAPRPGTVTRISLPSGDDIRVDTHLRAGSIVPPFYDSLVAKLIATGSTGRPRSPRCGARWRTWKSKDRHQHPPASRPHVRARILWRAASTIITSNTGSPGDEQHVERCACCCRGRQVQLLGTTAALLELHGSLDLATQRRVWGLAAQAATWPDVTKPCRV